MFHISYVKILIKKIHLSKFNFFLFNISSLIDQEVRLKLKLIYLKNFYFKKENENMIKLNKKLDLKDFYYIMVLYDLILQILF